MTVNDDPQFLLLRLQNGTTESNKSNAVTRVASSTVQPVFGAHCDVIEFVSII